MECRTDDPTYHYDDAADYDSEQEQAAAWLEEVEEMADLVPESALLEALAKLIEDDWEDAKTVACNAVLGVADEQIKQLKRRAQMLVAFRSIPCSEWAYSGDLELLENEAGREAK